VRAAGDTGIGVIIGTLGLYAAMMAVLAVGAEVVVDMVRPTFGLRRTTPATKAFSKLREWLPGTVKELGLPEEAESRPKDAIDDLETVTKQFGGQARQARLIVLEQWPNILKDLAVQSADKVLEERWSEIKSRLKQGGLNDQDVEKVHAWLAETLN
jgi:hypothetical protein